MSHEWETDNIAGEEISVRTLSCGLPVLVVRKPGFARKHASFAVRYGSCDRSFRPPGEDTALTVPDGIAHFLEHKLFEGREGNALEVFSRRGALVNAGTSYRFTFYFFTSTSEFEENLRLLMDFVRRPFLTEENVRKEQGIIAQEIRMYDDNPDDVKLRLLLRALFAEHPIRYHIAGTVTSIAKITPELLTKCFEAFYRPENMVLCAVGDVDRDRVWETAGEEALKMPEWCARAGQPERITVAEREEAACPELSRRMPVGLPKVVVGFKEASPSPEDGSLLERQVATDFLIEILFGRGSDAYKELYDEGIVDESFFSFGGIYPDIGFVTAGGDTPRPDDLVKRLLEYAEGASSRVREEDFERVRRKFTGEFIRRFNAVEYLGTACVSYFLNGIALREVWEALGKITVRDVRKRAETLFRRKSHAVAKVLPMEWE